MHIQRQNQGLTAFSITDAERAAAAAALSILKPFPRVTLTIAAEFYRKHFMPEGGDLQVKELVERYLAHKRSEKLRPRSLEDLKSRLTRFAAAFGDRLVKEVGHDELRAWIFDDPTLQAQTKRTFAL